MPPAKTDRQLNVLAVRFSAIGDVSLLVPAFQQVLASNPELNIIFVSKPFFEPLFTGIDRLKFIGIKLNDYQGLRGLFKLSSLLLNFNQNGLFLDLHDSLRTKILRSIWQLRGKKVFVLDKGRAQKAALIRKRHKILHPLKHAVERYLDVFKVAGVFINISDRPANSAESGVSEISSIPTVDTVIIERGTVNWLGGKLATDLPHYPQPNRKAYQLGFAPFAGFDLKEFEPEKKVDLLKLLLKSYPQSTIILFGGKEKQAELQKLCKATSADEFNGSVVLASDLAGNFQEELKLIQQLDLMLSMDSGNLHLAAISGVRVLGIYGTTHPYLGFSPYGQEQSGTVGLEGLECRPCTVYGNGKCYRGDFACMRQLPLDLIIEKINSRLEC